MADSVKVTLGQLTHQFAQQLPARLVAIKACFKNDAALTAQSQLEVLHHLVHGLAGAAGTFGMHAVSESARVLEIALGNLLQAKQAPTDTQWVEIQSAFDRLERIAYSQLSRNAPSLSPSPTARPDADTMPLVYMVEDDAEQARYLEATLTAADFRVRVFSTIDDFRTWFQRADQAPPGAVVMDMAFAEGPAAGAHIITELGLTADNPVPVIFVSVHDDIAARLAAFRAGACRYLVKPVDQKRLCRLLDEVTGRKPVEPYRILLVDDDELLLQSYCIALREAGMQVCAVPHPLQLLDAMASFKPDVVVLDMYMPDARGPELAAVLREQDVYAQTPILFLSSEVNLDRQLQALAMGGEDFLVKPIALSHLVAAVALRAKRSRQNADLTHRLQLALYEREREHMALDQHALVSITDRAGKLIYANDAFFKASGYEPQEFMGQDHRLLRSGQHDAGFFRDMWATLRSGNIWRGEICNRSRQGTHFWVNATITPFLDHAGSVYQYVSIATDISNVKHSEHALKVSEQRFRDLAESASDWFWETDADLRLRYVSERLFVATGLHPVDVLGKRRDEIGSIGLTNNVHFGSWQRNSAQMQARDPFKNFVYDLTTPNGCISISDSGRPFYDERGQFCGYRGTGTDVTPMVKAQARLARSDKASALAYLVAGIAHEMNTPIGNSLLVASTLEQEVRQFKANAQQGVRKSDLERFLGIAAEAGEILTRSMNHATALINRFKSLGERGHALERKEFQLLAIVDQAISAQAWLIDIARVAVEAVVPKDIVVKSYPALIEDILAELIRNALLHGFEGRESGRLGIRACTSPDGEIQIRVSDNGKGIFPADIEKVFDPFFTTKMGRAEAGLGLSIVRNVTENVLGGRIDVRSVEGQGTEVAMAFPNVSPEVAAQGDGDKTVRAV